MEVAVGLEGSPFKSLLANAREGDTIGIVGDDIHRGVLRPTLVVLEPDSLVDVTTLCACLRHYGFHALNSLLARYTSRETTKEIQLGNMANDFFDACVNSHSAADSPDERHAMYLDAVARSFHSNPLIYSALDGLDRGFFYDAEQQFLHILDTVRTTLPSLGIHADDILLEPQFLSPELGLQGRLDALCPDAIIELKSGKADEFHGGKPKEEHELQMILYKEIMHHTLRRSPSSMRNLLFYSRYPKLLSVRHTQLQLQCAIAVRNDIVALERDTRLGRLPEIIARLTEADFNTAHDDGKLYNNYTRPTILRFLERMQQLPPLETAYFHTFAQFIAREQHAAKQRFAQVWLTSLDDQVAEGEAAVGLTLHPIEDLEGSIVELRADSPCDLSGINFRRGDSVILFEQTDTAVATGIKAQIFRCQIVGIGERSLHLALGYKQSSSRVFRLDRPYALTHSYMEATFMQACRGLTALITAPDHRRSLLLGTRQPTTVAGDTPPAEFDYFLLVGPPGTGKTNVQLRGMVRRFLGEGQTLLLMAYTNQAVDEICGVLHEECPDLYARVGNENSCAVPYRMRMMQNITASAANRREVAAALQPLRVICGTIASIASHPELFRLKQFDTTIVDEASQVLEPQILPILCRVGRFILIGDHKQLPAVVMQDRTDCEVTDPRLTAIGLTNCANSYFERLYDLQHRWGIAHLTTATLRRQGRMHGELMSFVNSHFYNGILDVVPLPHQTAPLPYDAPRRLFVDVPAPTAIRTQRGQDSPHSLPAPTAIHKGTNVNEAQVVADLVAEIRATYASHSLPFSPTRTIGVIVPFRAQITAIRSRIADRQLADSITIDTVERYQGSQRDIIIFSTVVTSPDQIAMMSAPVLLPDGTEIDRKLNVALTRARERLILVGHRKTLIHSTLYSALIGSMSSEQA